MSAFPCISRLAHIAGSHLRHRLRHAALAAFLLAGVVPSVSAQERAVIAVKLVATSVMPDSVPLIVHLNRLGEAQLLLKEGVATPADLASGVETVRVLRARYGDQMPRDLQVVPLRSTSSRSAAQEHARYSGYLRLLASSAPDNKDTKSITVLVDASSMPSTTARIYVDSTKLGSQRPPARP